METDLVINSFSITWKIKNTAVKNKYELPKILYENKQSSMCPRHEPGMGTDQKPTWDKQGVTLSLADMRQAPPSQTQLYPHGGQSRTCFRTKGSYPWYKEEWLAAGWQRASQNHRRRCRGGGTLRGSCHQSCQQSHSSYSVGCEEITVIEVGLYTEANNTLFFHQSFRGNHLSSLQGSQLVLHGLGSLKAPVHLYTVGL